MSNYCKYYRQQKYMSIDGGITWTPLQEYQKGRLIERNSDECGYVDPIYRTITSEPYCSGETGYDKYVNELSQVSYDNGRTWQTTATTPTLVEANSKYCGYRPTPIYEWRVIAPTSDPNTYICNDCGYVPPTPPTPSGDSRQYLTFRPHGDTEFWFSYGDSENYTSISYSLNSGSTWTVVDHNQHTVTVHSGDTIMWRGYAANLGGEGAGIGTFHSSGSTWEVEGNIMSLLYFDNFSGQTSLSGPNVGDSAYVFSHLFYQCVDLVNAENLVLPSTTLTEGCYFMMFVYTRITTAPTLIATTLTEACYFQMFNGCNSLTSITCLATNISAVDCTTDWMWNVCQGSTSGTFTTPSSTNWASGSSGIPSCFTRINA